MATLAQLQQFATDLEAWLVARPAVDNARAVIAGAELRVGVQVNGFRFQVQLDPSRSQLAGRTRAEVRDHIVNLLLSMVDGQRNAVVEQGGTFPWARPT